MSTWQMWVPQIGPATVYVNEFGYAGGFVLVGIGDGGSEFEVHDLGDGNVALSATLTDPKGNAYTFYWNSHYQTKHSDDNGGMVLWNTIDGYASNSIGSEQTFRLINLGQGNVALQAVGGAFPGQYLYGREGGWYPGPSGWNLGTGSFLAVNTDAPLQVRGDMLPILLITHSGYQLDLSGRDLTGVNLAGADMTECKLDRANLSNVASISEADFRSASLRAAVLNGLDLSAAKTWAGADFTGTDLTQITGAEKADMPGTILDRARLPRAMNGVNLRGAKLRGAVLDGTYLTGANLDDADLTGSSLKGTVMHGASLRGTRFDGADLTTAQFDPVPAFTRATTRRTTFVGAIVPFRVLASDWSYLDLTKATVTGLPAAITSFVADGALLPNGLDLQKMDLSGAAFIGTRMYEVQLQNANLQGATLTGALLKGARLNKANLTLAKLDSAYLVAEQGRPATLHDVSKFEPAVVTEAFLFNAVLDGAHCDGVDFSGAFFVTAPAISDSQAASAVSAFMNFAKFDQSKAVGAVFDGAQLSAASFVEATLVGASFRDDGTRATQLTPSSDDIHTRASARGADIRGADFTGANMDGLNMQNACYSTTTGPFESVYIGFAGKEIPVAFTYGPTVLGNTTSNTTCPNGADGPCSLSPEDRGPTG